jgi:phosphatidate cytidylyltransferase
MLKQRTITAAIGLPVLLAAVWFSRPVPWFTMLVVVVGGAGVVEFYRLSGVARVRSLLLFGTVWTVLAIAARDTSVLTGLGLSMRSEELALLLVTSATVLPLTWMLRRGPRNEAFANWAWCLAGIVYIGLLLGYFVALRQLDEGRNWVYFALLTTFASDTAAFFVGRAWGKRRLAPSISPSKTWEGSVGGLLGACLVGLLFVPATAPWGPNPLQLTVLNYGSAAVLALLVSIVGQLGDLVESLFKRNMGTKDSGRLFPGHGGALDRLDSVAFAGLVVYYFVWLIR